MDSRLFIGMLEKAQSRCVPAPETLQIASQVMVESADLSPSFCQ